MKAATAIALVAVFGCGNESGSSKLDGSGPQGSAVEGNSPPSVPEIQLTPENPTGSDDLVVNLVTPSTDVDGDSVEYLVRWSVDDEVLDDLVSLTLDAAFTHKGERWSVEVAAFDGRLQSTSVYDSVTIKNSVPTVQNIVVTPDNPTVKDELRCGYDDPVDLDNDEVGVAQSWAINGVDIEVEGPLTAPYFIKHDAVECLVFAEDGTDDIAPYRSDVVTIENSRPNVIGCSLNDNNPPEDADVLAVSEGFYDDDGDPEGYRYAWFVNDALVSNEAQLSASFTETGDSVYVECTAWDGENEGNTVTSGFGTIVD